MKHANRPRWHADATSTVPVHGVYGRIWIRPRRALSPRTTKTSVQHFCIHLWYSHPKERVSYHIICNSHQKTVNHTNMVWTQVLGVITTCLVPRLVFCEKLIQSHQEPFVLYYTIHFSHHKTFNHTNMVWTQVLGVITLRTFWFILYHTLITPQDSPSYQHGVNTSIWCDHMSIWYDHITSCRANRSLNHQGEMLFVFRSAWENL